MKKTKGVFIFLAMIALFKPAVFSHCEIPCGVYDDEMRFTMIKEHITTIEKAIKKIVNLSGQQPPNFNQIVRWVTNKEKHAEDIQHIISQYFLTQRVKLVEKEDDKANESRMGHLSLCHEILVYTMKTKQTTDLSNVEKLKTAVKAFKDSYFKAKAEK
ncbi:MAG TPA: superoxide dismutase [Candidatus Aminicenantes bacterium]|nr:superoxide dismutase [Candidatus Aminicenantes bacterium]